MLTRIHVKIEGKILWILLRRRNDSGIKRVGEARQADGIDSCQAMDERIKLPCGIVVIGWFSPYFILAGEKSC